MKEEILRHYEACRLDLETVKRALEHDLLARLKEARLDVSGIIARVKSLDSLRGKLQRPDRTYSRLDQVHDLLGLRVVTYFEDGVEDVADVIEKSYEVDWQHSIDKGRQLDPTQFGYRSLHYVCAFPRALAGGFENLRFEIQVRSLLQHAWAQMEHDLGYKSKESIPLAFRRRFSRLAGLLEIVDEEFVSLRRSLEGYSRELQEGLETVSVDSLSLTSFIRTDRMREVDQLVADWLGVGLSELVFYPEYLVRMLNFLEVKDIGQLSCALERSKASLGAVLEPYFRFAESVWGLSRQQIRSVERGYSLLFLGHLLLLEESRLEIERIERLTAFYRTLDYPDNPEVARQVALGLLETFSGWP
ncbi:MAG: GTP pyrophosphokinase family protein [Vulcanimicrobiota bacterium]